MLTLFGGEADGVTLQVRRSPLFLRAVVNAAGEWDLLDQPTDEVGADEISHVYFLVKWMGNYHIRAGKGRSGFYPQALYWAYDTEPVEPGNEYWSMWVNEEMGLPAEYSEATAPEGHELPAELEQWRGEKAKLAEDRYAQHLRDVSRRFQKGGE